MAETREGEPATELYRGIARVGLGTPPVVRGVAVVPGALSVPGRRPAPPAPPPPAVLFERAEAPVVAPPPIRAPAPDTPVVGTAEPSESPENPVRKRVLSRLGRGAALPAAAAALAAFVTATTYLALAGRATESDPDLGRWAASAQVTAPASIQGAGNAGRPPGDPFGSAPMAVGGVPTRVRVAAIGLDSPLETLHIAKGALQPPKRFDRAGWYADGTAPGDVGPAVIAGHVDSKAGPAIFYRLRELTVGDRIEVQRGGTTLRFTVTRMAWYPKDEFPTEEVYGPTPDRQLRLITCGGVFDHKLRSYRDNLVVYAVAG